MSVHGRGVKAKLHRRNSVTKRERKAAQINERKLQKCEKLKKTPLNADYE